MKAYAINYDLKVPGRDYKGLYDAIKGLEKWWHYLDSTWIVATSRTPRQIWEVVSPHIDTSDRILIIEVRDNVQGWLPKDAWAWIHENVER